MQTAGQEVPLSEGDESDEGPAFVTGLSDSLWVRLQSDTPKSQVET
jgi:hypothetical protein